jgi:hypothetical protein
MSLVRHTDIHRNDFAECALGVYLLKPGKSRPESRAAAGVAIVLPAVGRLAMMSVVGRVAIARVGNLEISRSAWGFLLSCSEVVQFVIWMRWYNCLCLAQTSLFMRKRSPTSEALSSHPCTWRSPPKITFACWRSSRYDISSPLPENFCPRHHHACAATCAPTYPRFEPSRLNEPQRSRPHSFLPWRVVVEPA